MTWSSSHVATKPVRVRRGGWSSNPIEGQRPTPKGGWTAITYMLAEAGLIGLSPAAMLQVLSKTSIPGFDGITPSATIDYVYHDVIAAAQLPDGLSPSASVDYASGAAPAIVSGIFPTADLVVNGDGAALPINLTPTASGLVIAGGDVDPFTNLAAAAQVTVLADAPASSISIAPVASAVFPTTAEVTTAITATGAYSYTIPYWCRYIDVIVLGGGGGGQGSGCCFVNGFGAAAGDFAVLRLERGVDIPWSLTTITGVVGTAGTGGNAGIGAIPGIPGSAGTATTAVISGVGTLTGAGGAGGALGVWGADISGEPAGTQAFQGKNYVGGNGGTSSGGNAQAPGGGGAAGAGGCCFGTKGGNGGRGQAWFRALQ